jgi:hypothetical protein
VPRAQVLALPKLPVQYLYPDQTKNAVEDERYQERSYQDADHLAHFFMLYFADFWHVRTLQLEADGCQQNNNPTH